MLEFGTVMMYWMMEQWFYSDRDLMLGFIKCLSTGVIWMNDWRTVKVFGLVGMKRGVKCIMI